MSTSSKKKTLMDAADIVLVSRDGKKMRESRAMTLVEKLLKRRETLGKEFSSAASCERQTVYDYPDDRERITRMADDLEAVAKYIHCLAADDPRLIRLWKLRHDLDEDWSIQVLALIVGEMRLAGNFQPIPPTKMLERVIDEVPRVQRALQVAPIDKVRQVRRDLQVQG